MSAGGGSSYTMLPAATTSSSSSSAVKSEQTSSARKRARTEPVMQQLHHPPAEQQQQQHHNMTLSATVPAAAAPVAPVAAVAADVKQLSALDISAPATVQRITMMTWNIWKKNGEPALWKERRATFAELLKTYTPDVLCVQEAHPASVSASTWTFIVLVF
jgi:Endonuclease/Exonuclease/phosphatase family